MTLPDGYRKYRGWISFAILAPAVAGALFSPLHFPLGSWGQFGCQTAGWLLFFAGAVSRWWATLYVGGKKSAELVTTGPYSITRNPIYVGTFLLTLSIGVFSQSLTFLLTVVVARLAFFLVTVSVEEARLRERYGAAMDDYCRRVPRFLPRVGRFESPPIIQVHLRGLWTELVRTGRWMWIPIACDALVRLRAADWWPHWFALP